VYSLLILPLFLGNVAMVAWVLRSWQRTRDPLHLVVLLPLVMLPYDTAIVGLGSTIGQGELLRQLTVPRVNWYYLTMPPLLIMAGGLVRRAGFTWAQPRWVMGASCVLAVALILADWRRILTAPDLYPACFGDLLRYVRTVPPDQVCTPGQAGVGATFSPSPAALVVMLAMLALGILLAWKRRWPWLLAGCVVSSVAMLVPAYGTPLGDIISMGSMAWTVVHFAGRRP
jgi:hypothetical protein